MRHTSIETVSVTVIMPVFQEADWIRRSLGSVLACDGEVRQLEVLVVDGGSTDGTRLIIDEMSKEHSSVVLVDNPGRIAPLAMNIGINHARGDIIIRVDGHCEVPRGFIKDSVSLLMAHPEAGCAGGVVETIGSGYWGCAIAAAMTSPFGVGGSKFRTGGFSGWVDTLAFGAYWKDVLVEIGLFDESLVRNQDDELNFRMIRSGFKIFMNSDIVTRYYARASVAKLWKQYYQYGFWKVRVIRKHRKPASIRHLVPAAFVLAIIIGVLLSAFWSLPLVVLLGSYFFAAFCAAFFAASDHGWAFFPAFFVIFPCLHVGYGSGFLRALVDRKKPEMDQISR